MSNSKKKSTDGKTVLVRIIAIILALLLLSSGIAMIIEMILPASADEPPRTESYAFASSLSNREFHVAVALRWGTSVTVSHEITSPYGFAVGEARITRTERSFTPVWQLSENDVVAAADCNLTVGYRTCSVALSDAETDIGCYHVELRLVENPSGNAPEGTAEPEETEEAEETEAVANEPEPESTEPTGTLPEETGGEETTAEPDVTGPEGQIPEEPAEREIWDYLDDMAAMFGITFEQVFPAFIMGEKVIRIGAFANYADATSAAAAIGAELEGFEVSVASPAFNGLCILNEDYDTILFKYAGEEYCDGAICALQNPESSSRSYLCFTGNGRLYDGAFCFRRYVSANNDADGLVLINLVELLSYCEGVIAGEIYNSWPKETLKAFAVTVNSFTTRNRNRRFEKYGCDLVASGEDQNYVGRSNVNANVENACREAYGKILTYTNPDTGKTQIVDAAYSSSQGGCSANSTYVWGGYSGPFIVSQPTPWEKYTEVSRGQWFFEVSPADLATQIKKYNSNLISGNSITSVEYETTGDSTYVYSISFTDNKGKTGTVTKCSSVNSAMGPYSYSANFVIGKNRVEYTYENVISTEIIDLTENYSGNLTVQTRDGKFNSTSLLFSFLSEFGITNKDESRSLYVRTADGTALLTGESDIPMTTLPDENGLYTQVSDYGNFLIVTKLQQFTKVYTAQTNGNYVIAGRGWGHGVGMSQYGACHLGRAGAAYNHILYAYYPGTDVGDFYEWMS